MLRLMLVMLSGVVLLGCESSPSKKIAETTVTEPAISKGMSLTNALRIMEANGVECEQIFTASALDEDDKKMRQFSIRLAFKTRDALTIVAISPINNDDFVIQNICWHLNSEEDSQFPWSLRGNKFLYLDHVDLSVLKEIPPEILQERSTYKKKHASPL